MFEARQEDSDWLRERAEQCFRLAGMAHQREVSDQLHRLGEEFEKRARMAEAREIERLRSCCKQS